MMDALFPWRRSKINREINRLDGYLHSTLTPVLPSSDFVENLRSRLIAEAYASRTDAQAGPLQFIFVILGMILSMSLVLITGLRIIATLAGILGRVQAALRKARQDKLTARPLGPVEVGP